MRVGILTSGGDCQALNATMRGLVKVYENHCHLSALASHHATSLL